MFMLSLLSMISSVSMHEDMTSLPFLRVRFMAEQLHVLIVRCLCVAVL